MVSRIQMLKLNGVLFLELLDSNEIMDPSVEVVMGVYCVFDIEASNQKQKKHAATQARVKWIITDGDKWAHIKQVGTQSTGKLSPYSDSRINVYSTADTDGLLPLELGTEDRDKIITAGPEVWHQRLGARQ